MDDKGCCLTYEVSVSQETPIFKWDMEGVLVIVLWIDTMTKEAYKKNVFN